MPRFWKVRRQSLAHIRKTFQRKTMASSFAWPMQKRLLTLDIQVHIDIPLRFQIQKPQQGALELYRRLQLKALPTSTSRGHCEQVYLRSKLCELLKSPDYLSVQRKAMIQFLIKLPGIHLDLCLSKESVSAKTTVMPNRKLQRPLSQEGFWDLILWKKRSQDD